VRRRAEKQRNSGKTAEKQRKKTRLNLNWKTMFHYLNENLSLEQCQELDKKSAENRQRLTDLARDLIDKAKPEHKGELSIKLTSALCMALPFL
jgi:hypothetical protein